MKICHVCLTECDDKMELCPLCGADLTVEDSEESGQAEKEITEPVLLATMQDVVSSEIFRDILKENNIPFFCDDPESSGTMHVLFGGSFVSENIYVDKSDYEKADSLYTEFLENEPEFDGDFSDEDFEE